jgi:hypothetical protein
VNASDAYLTWFSRHLPSIDEELEVAAWLATFEDDGPPPSATAHGANHWAEGPGGRSMTFRVFETSEDDTVAGYIYVLDIQ